MGWPLRILGTSVLGLLVIGLSGPSFGQEPKTRVYVRATTPDTVGKTLVYNIREQINSSSRYELAATESDAVLQFRIVTLDPDESASQKSTVYSAVLTGTQTVSPHATVYLKHWVGTCRVSVAVSCAENVFADVDMEVAPVLESVLISRTSTRKK
jgi:hypothetical protein